MKPDCMRDSLSLREVVKKTLWKLPLRTLIRTFQLRPTQLPYTFISVLTFPEWDVHDSRTVTNAVCFWLFQVTFKAALHPALITAHRSSRRSGAYAAIAARRNASMSCRAVCRPAAPAPSAPLPWRLSLSAQLRAQGRSTWSSGRCDAARQPSLA